MTKVSGKVGLKTATEKKKKKKPGNEQRWQKPMFSNSQYQMGQNMNNDVQHENMIQV